MGKARYRGPWGNHVKSSGPDRFAHGNVASPVYDELFSLLLMRAEEWSGAG